MLTAIKETKLEIFKKYNYYDCKHHGRINTVIISEKRKTIICLLCSNIARKRGRKKDVENLEKYCEYMFRGARQRSIEKNREITITAEDVKDLLIQQNKKCKLSGIEFDTSRSYKPSIDRIDSNKGYTKDNIQLICLIINKMKSNLNQKEFIEICMKIQNTNQ